LLAAAEALAAAEFASALALLAALPRPAFVLPPGEGSRPVVPLEAVLLVLLLLPLLNQVGTMAPREDLIAATEFAALLLPLVAFDVVAALLVLLDSADPSASSIRDSDDEADMATAAAATEEEAGKRGNTADAAHEQQRKRHLSRPLGTE